MHIIFKETDFVVIISSLNPDINQYANSTTASTSIISNIDSIILTENFLALIKNRYGIVKKIPLFFINYNDKEDDEIKDFWEHHRIGLYHITGSFIDSAIKAKEEDILQELISILTSKQEQLIRANNNRNLSVFADKSLFEVYFKAIRKSEIKMQKIFFQR